MSIGLGVAVGAGMSVGFGAGVGVAAGAQAARTNIAISNTDKIVVTRFMFLSPLDIVYILYRFSIFKPRQIIYK
jgi:hypothetical protein